MEKQDLRKQVTLEREKLSKNQFWLLNDSLLVLFSKLDWSKINTVHLFLPIVEKKEIDTFEFIHFFKTKYPHIKMLVPRCDFKTKEMEAILFDPQATVLVKNKQQIPEPLYGETVDPKLIDAVVIPLLAFDKQGHRVGYGGGFYDRFLKKCRPDVLKIGVSLFEPTAQILDTHQQDIKLTCCVTPQKIHSFE
ncbi:5-formyltetrahydrofolate cyclo-ligase [Pedobacter arcticus]|uniref:5-formyltetrahydrofolate cyclo-ligase n=1 Tax=Pedobacter arcticus TaxID=752140 RepID=UPI0002E804C2|nr:5-formyltetrahydrofolate cyclo-ligase [Pedobacter arcticus]